MKNARVSIALTLAATLGENSLHRPLNHLAKVYIEPTNGCNLDCVTCFRNAWETNIGRMSEATSATILAGLAQIDPLPTVYFGGIGEPMFHQLMLTIV